MRRLFLASAVAVLLLFLAPLSPRAAGSSPPHLDRANALADALREQTLAGLLFDGSKPLNDYSSEHFTQWREDGPAWSESRNLCNTLVAASLKKSYGWKDSTFKLKFGATWPTSEKFYDDILTGKGFLRITSLDDVAPGDVVALWYRDDPASGYPSPTGHTYLIVSLGPPTPYTFPNGVSVNYRDTCIIDSAQTCHSVDTRAFADGELGAGSAATDWKGCGRGWLRIYVDDAGEYLGYTWSLTGDRTKPPGTPPTWTYYSTYFKPESLRHFVVGRVLP